MATPSISSPSAGVQRRPADVPRREAHGDGLRSPAVPRGRDLLSLSRSRTSRCTSRCSPWGTASRCCGRARRHPREPLRRRRDHRAVGRLQGAREHRRVQRHGVAIDTRVAVLLFGFAHGFGLSTKLQDLTLSKDGLVGNMLSFNVGVEIGPVRSRWPSSCSASSSGGAAGSLTRRLRRQCRAHDGRVRPVRLSADRVSRHPELSRELKPTARAGSRRRNAGRRGRRGSRSWRASRRSPSRVPRAGNGRRGS